MSTIYKTDTIRIETEESEIPWLKIFTEKPYKEMSEVPAEVRREIHDLLYTIEVEMLDYYKPEKINTCCFGNYMPLVHWHINARFKEDSFFPENMWGKRQREGSVKVPSYQVFCDNLVKKLEEGAKKIGHLY